MAQLGMPGTSQTLTSETVRTALRELVGDAGLVPSTDEENYLNDFYEHYQGEALAIVRPATTNEVAAVVRYCAEHDISIVPQGGNSGLCGGSIPNDSTSVVITMQRMSQVESVDADRYSMTVQAGVTIQTIQETAAQIGRMFGPDWGARGSAHIGGAISTNAGGINVLQFGSMRENIMGIEAVLADGRVWNGLRALRKDSSGLDLKHLFIGTEGTLGIVTRAVVKLRPAMPEQQTAFAALADVSRLSELSALAIRHGQGGLTAFELIPELGVATVCEQFDKVQRPLKAVADWYMMIRLSGATDITTRLTDLLTEAANGGLILDAAVATTAEQEENLWMLRDELPPQRLFPHGDSGLKLDVAVPIDVVPDYYKATVSAAAALFPDTVPYAFGHAGDGNLHLYFMADPEADQATADAFSALLPELTKALHHITWDFGGTVSAEHGIGQLLRTELAQQKSEVEIDLMRAVKNAIDPSGRLNPGKVLPD